MTSKDKFFSNKLLEWYEKNQRGLPWRKNIRHKDYPYRVLVSEFMLQQTTVATVIPYFKKFINEWPTLKKLSHAKIEQVLLFWQGLGYYSRAKNLLQTVKIIDKDYNGKIPKNKINLIKLPGIGEYASAAISSIAFNKKAVAIDGNVKRVIARYNGLEGTLDFNFNSIKRIANLICPDSNHRNYTQGIMELGALICKPKKPDCINCVISSNCIAFNNDKTDSIPLPKKKLKKKKLKCVTYLAIKNSDSVLLIQRKGKNILKDQWELPSTDWNKESVNKVSHNFPIKNIKWKRSKVNFNHSFTHIDLFNSVYVSKMDTYSSEIKKVAKSRWIYLHDLDSYPLTTMSKKTLELHNLI